MKSIFALLLLSSSLAFSATLTSSTIERNQESLNQRFSSDRVIQREVRSVLVSREARKCRFCPRAMAQARVSRTMRGTRVSREIRVARVEREILYIKDVERQNKKLAIAIVK